MSDVDAALPDVLSHSPVTVIAGAGALVRLGDAASEHGAHRVLLVTDPGIRQAGHVERAVESLRASGVDVAVFDGVSENPTTEQVADGLAFAHAHAIDFIIGLGGGSAMDCAKGINLLLTNGGEIKDYWGEDKPREPLLPMIAIPTTAGTGSEGQSFALISDAATHQKMACGDRRLPREGGLRPRVAILDPDLTLTAPKKVAAAAGIDALAHVIETAGTTRRTDTSRAFTQAAWRRIERALPTVLENPKDAAARQDMLLGAHLAGCAIEFSMLGAAHACANPLTARFGVVHGVAVGVMLPHVIRFNAAGGENPYAVIDPDAERLAAFVDAMLARANVATRLGEYGIKEADIPQLAEAAASQWTAQFNPRPVDAAALATIYRRAL
ncbi:MAG: iron-containing alcohol dehydrogenase [Phycisphaerales bacterium]|nr:iron-containing alcohol dehydrogenase [Phycisphaerales bacterium]